MGLTDLKLNQTYLKISLINKRNFLITAITQKKKKYSRKGGRGGVVNVETFILF